MRRTLTKADPLHAYAVIRRDTIDVFSVEEFSESGRQALLKQLNKPAGERVAHVLITEVKT